MYCGGKNSWMDGWMKHDGLIDDSWMDERWMDGWMKNEEEWMIDDEYKVHERADECFSRPCCISLPLQN